MPSFRFLSPNSPNPINRSICSPTIALPLSTHSTIPIHSIRSFSLLLPFFHIVSPGGQATTLPAYSLISGNHADVTSQLPPCDSESFISDQAQGVYDVTLHFQSSCQSFLIIFIGSTLISLGIISCSSSQMSFISSLLPGQPVGEKGTSICFINFISGCFSRIQLVISFAVLYCACVGG